VDHGAAVTEEELRGDPPARRVRPVTILLALVVLGLAGMWVYAFFFANRQNPDIFPDRAWAERATVICEEYQAQIDALPPARSFRDISPKEEALRQRADVADEATVLLRTMVAELGEVEPADAKSRAGVALWYDDWALQLADRDRHVGKWRAGLDEQFAETAVRGREVGRGIPVSLRMQTFASLNGMKACAPSQDLG
jgi:hypothetical protein